MNIREGWLADICVPATMSATSGNVARILVWILITTLIPTLLLKQISEGRSRVDHMVCAYDGAWIVHFWTGACSIEHEFSFLIHKSFFKTKSLKKITLGGFNPHSDGDLFISRASFGLGLQRVIRGRWQRFERKV
jgi:hypothetical protein